jgi:very-short-patch-repair endonuclease
MNGYMLADWRVLPIGVRKGLMEEAGIRSGSDVEDWVALCLLRWECREAVAMQYPVSRYRLDFAWPRLKIALEMDGIHHTSDAGLLRDAKRDRELRNKGWIIMRVDAEAADMEDRFVRILRMVYQLSDCESTDYSKGEWQLAEFIPGKNVPPYVLRTKQGKDIRRRR